MVLEGGNMADTVRHWLNGNCLAGDMCIFSHDPAHFVNKLQIEGASTPPIQSAGINLSDWNNFPALQPGTPEQLSMLAAAAHLPSLGLTPPPPGFKHFLGFPGDRPRSRSRPGSRHLQQGNLLQAQKDVGQAAPSMDDADAFPSLGSVAAKQGKKHHGKRGGHGHGHKENFTPSTLADIVKMSPSPSAGAARSTSRVGRNGSATNVRNGENSPAAQAIQPPRHIPWLETGEKANRAYLKARQEAIKHGGLRNKFLQR